MMGIFKCFTTKTKPHEMRSNSVNKPIHNSAKATDRDDGLENASNFSSSQASNFNQIHRKNSRVINGPYDNDTELSAGKRSISGPTGTRKNLKRNNKIQIEESTSEYGNNFVQSM